MKLLEDIDHFTERRTLPLGTAIMMPADEITDLPEETVFHDEGHEAARGMEEEGVERDRPLLLPDNPAGSSPDGGEPGGDLPAVADGCRKEQEIDPDGQVDHDLLPDDPAVPVSQKVCLIEDDQIAVQVFPCMHRVVELIPEDLGGSGDDRRVGVLFCISGDDADVHRAEEVAELDPFGIGQGLQGRSVPAATALQKDRSDRLFGDPCFPRAGRGHDKAVVGADGVKRFKLKRIRPELRGNGFADLRED